jgi:hypothetical protein
MAAAAINTAFGGTRPPTFGGNEADFPEWSFVTDAYIRRHDGAGRLLDQALVSDNPIEIDGMTPDAVKLAQQIQTDLVLLCTDKARRLLMNLPENPMVLNRGEC